MDACSRIHEANCVSCSARVTTFLLTEDSRGSTNFLSQKATESESASVQPSDDGCGNERVFSFASELELGWVEQKQARENARWRGLENELELASDELK